MFKQLIAGELVEGDGKPLEVINPTTGKVLEVIPTATEEQTQKALESAQKAFERIVLDLEGERRAALVDRSGRERVVVECPDFPYLGLWTADKPFDTGYFCIEPWSALPDAVFVGRGLEDKAGIRRLEPGGVHVLTYTTTFQ